MDVHVLVADDNEDHRFLTRRALESLATVGTGAGGADPEGVIRVRVSVACDGEEAVAFLRRALEEGGSTRPDLVLLDLKMPRMDGFAVLRDLKADPLLRAIPVLVLSSSDNDRDVARAYDLGANAYLVKPMNGAEFTAALRESARYWVRTVTLPPREGDGES